MWFCYTQKAPRKSWQKKERLFLLCATAKGVHLILLPLALFPIFFYCSD